MRHRRAIGASHHTIFRMMHTIFRMMHTIFRMMHTIFRMMHTIFRMMHTIFRMMHTIFRMMHTIFRMINGRYALSLRARLPFAKVVRKRASSGSGADRVESRPRSGHGGTFWRGNDDPRRWAASELSCKKPAWAPASGKKWTLLIFAGALWAHSGATVSPGPDITGD